MALLLPISFCHPISAKGNPYPCNDEVTMHEWVLEM